MSIKNSVAVLLHHPCQAPSSYNTVCRTVLVSSAHFQSHVSLTSTEGKDISAVFRNNSSNFSQKYYFFPPCMIFLTCSEFHVTQFHLSAVNGVKERTCNCLYLYFLKVLGCVDSHERLCSIGFPGGSVVKNLPAGWETQV